LSNRQGLHQARAETLEAVIQARNSAVSGLRAAAPIRAMPRRGSARRCENQLTGALGRLFALSEAYPDLKANTTMMQLSEELTSTENKVAFARQAYNDGVLGYNNKREVFPNNLVAGMFAFGHASFLELDEPAKREVPKVSFS
jgi:LemA protein